MAEAAFTSSNDFTKLQMSTASMNEWFNSDITSFLNPEVIMDFQTVPPTSDETTALYYSTSSPEQAFSVSDSSPYSSDASETSIPSPFDQFNTDSIHSGISSPIDESLFEPFQLADPLIVPEIEKILAANPYQMELDVPASPEPTAHAFSNKKRQRETDSKVPVTLARDQLLTMTSKEIEEYVSEVKSKRALTAAEEKDLKKQRRLVKNREYASQSRSRKKLFVDELEKQLEVSRAETEEAKKQNKALMDENKLLKRQLGCIAETIKKSQLNAGNKDLAASGTSSLSASSGSLSTSSSVFDKLKIGAGRTPATKGVSACLLAIFFMVFTFAAFWDNESNFAKPNHFSRRELKSFSFEDEAGVWEAASTLLRQSWEASSEYLPSWESAYSLFISSYPIFFSPSSSPSSITPMPASKAIDPITPCTEHSHPSLPPTNNNETQRCMSRASAS